MAIISNRWVKGGNRLPLAYIEKHLPMFVDQDGQTYKLGRKTFGKYEIIQGKERTFADIKEVDNKFKNNQFKLI